MTITEQIEKAIDLKNQIEEEAYYGQNMEMVLEEYVMCYPEAVEVIEEFLQDCRLSRGM